MKLPALLGMLLTGIILKNLPGLEFEDTWPDYASTLRGTALVIILMRAGLGLDPQALKENSGKVVWTSCRMHFIWHLFYLVNSGWLMVSQKM